MRNFILALLLVGAAGCGPGTTPQAQADKNKAQIVKLLPPNHTDLTDLGNEWYTFRLDVGGKKRLFLTRWWASNNGGWTGQTITELQGD